MANGMEMFLASKKSAVFSQYRRPEETPVFVSQYKSAVQRADRIRQYAIRDVELHGWQVRPTQDFYGLAVEHGDYQVSLMFGKQLTGYVEHGAQLEGTAGRSHR